MAIKKKIQLSVEPEIYDLIRELSQETETSMSAFIAEYLLQIAPILEKNLEIIKMAKQVKEEGRKRVSSYLEEIVNVMEEEIKQVKEASEHAIQ